MIPEKSARERLGYMVSNYIICMNEIVKWYFFLIVVVFTVVEVTFLY